MNGEKIAISFIDRSHKCNGWFATQISQVSQFYRPMRSSKTFAISSSAFLVSESRESIE